MIQIHGRSPSENAYFQSEEAAGRYLAAATAAGLEPAAADTRLSAIQAVVDAVPLPTEATPETIAQSNISDVIDGNPEGDLTDPVLDEPLNTSGDSP